MGKVKKATSTVKIATHSKKIKWGNVGKSDFSRNLEGKTVCVHEILMTTTVFGDRKKSEHTSKKSDPVKKATSRKKSDIDLKNDQKSEKKQNDEFSHEK